jgi:membrane-bound metal-dependent hydrolase YbcI (DUF457 family)
LANREAHIPAGILAPWIVLLLYLALSNGILPSMFVRYPWFLVALLMSVFSFAGERIPDKVEPPKDPHHRGIIHWLGFAALLYIVWFLLTNPNLPLISTSYEHLSGLLVISFLSGYVSHFVLDYLLPA